MAPTGGGPGGDHQGAGGARGAGGEEGEPGGRQEQRKGLGSQEKAESMVNFVILEFMWGLYLLDDLSS